MTSKIVRASTGSRKLASGKTVERIVGKNGRALLSFAGCNEVLNLCVVANGYHTRGEDIPGTPRYVSRGPSVKKKCRRFGGWARFR
jgi:hypothetical protein